VPGRALLTLLVSILGCAPWGTAQPIGYVHVSGARPPETFCGGKVSADSTVYDTTQVTQQPVLYEAEPLNYPREQRGHGVQGRVVLAVTVNANGRPDSGSIQMISSPDSALTEAATRWVRTAKFVPSCLADAPVRVRVAIPVVFKREK
jgi:TonB family protein